MEYLAGIVAAYQWRRENCQGAPTGVLTIECCCTAQVVRPAPSRRKFGLLEPVSLCQCRWLKWKFAASQWSFSIAGKGNLWRAELRVGEPIRPDAHRGL